MRRKPFHDAHLVPTEEATQRGSTRTHDQRLSLSRERRESAEDLRDARRAPPSDSMTNYGAFGQMQEEIAYGEGTDASAGAMTPGQTTDGLVEGVKHADAERRSAAKRLPALATAMRARPPVSHSARGKALLDRLTAHYACSQTMGEGMRREIKGKGTGEAISHYTDAVRFGDLLFISGAMPVDEAGNVVSDELVVQTRQVFKHIGAILEACYAADGEHWSAFILASCSNCRRTSWQSKATAPRRWLH
jgi:enamine deaminase RidA (YjgF/YER057c/UK114 family)